MRPDSGRAELSVVAGVCARMSCTSTPVEMRERLANSHTATSTEQVRERLIVNLGCPGSFYPRVDTQPPAHDLRFGVSDFTGRPSA